MSNNNTNFQFTLTGPQVLGLGCGLGLLFAWSFSVYKSNQTYDQRLQYFPQNNRNDNKYRRRMNHMRGRPSIYNAFDERIFDDEYTDTHEIQENPQWKKLSPERKLKDLKTEIKELRELLALAESRHQVTYGEDTWTQDDIHALRVKFQSCIPLNSDKTKLDLSGLMLLMKKLGEPISNEEGKKIIGDRDNEISFPRFFGWYKETQKLGKQSKRYGNRFKFKEGNIVESQFIIQNIVTKEVGMRATPEYRVTFNYKNKNGHLKQISPWHDIPLYVYGPPKSVLKKHNKDSKDDQKESTESSDHNVENAVVHFICEIPKWTRAKFEIATGEEFNPIRQDLRSGKLRYYQHGDMMFNYGALPQTWEDPSHIPPDTGVKGDNDPLDAIEVGTKQLKTGSVTPVKVLGVLPLLDSGETDWKILVINNNDPLASKLNDVDDIDQELPGAIHAIREYLRIYKVCTGKSANTYALRGEAKNTNYANGVIHETHEQWLKLKQKNQTVV